MNLLFSWHSRCYSSSQFLHIAKKQVYQTEKKEIKASAYSPETGLPDRKKRQIEASAYSPETGLQDRKKKEIKASAYSPETGLQDRKKTKSLKHLLIVPKQVYKTETGLKKKKQIKASAYSPKTGLQDRQKQNH